MNKDYQMYIKYFKKCIHLQKIDEKISGMSKKKIDISYLNI